MSGLHLCQTSYDNDIEGVKAILKKRGINVNYRDESEWTPLMNACYAGAPRIVEILLKQDTIDTNASDNVSPPFLRSSVSFCDALRVLFRAAQLP